MDPKTAANSNSPCSRASVLCVLVLVVLTFTPSCTLSLRTVFSACCMLCFLLSAAACAARRQAKPRPGGVLGSLPTGPLQDPTEHNTAHPRTPPMQLLIALLASFGVAAADLIGNYRPPSTKTIPASDIPTGKLSNQPSCPVSPLSFCATL
jgi:hypothetical protein